MQPQDKGVLIRRVEPTAPLHQHVSQYDILLSFDGSDIANDGTVPFRSGERISFSYLVSQVRERLPGAAGTSYCQFCSFGCLLRC